MASSKEEPVDFLKPDETQIPGQRYALISVVSPTSSQKNDMCGIKIKGVFETIEEAQLYAKKITQLDPLFDIFLVEMYKWLKLNRLMLYTIQFVWSWIDPMYFYHTQPTKPCIGRLLETKMFVLPFARFVCKGLGLLLDMELDTPMRSSC